MLAAAIGFIAACQIAPSQAQSLGDTLGDAVDGITGGLGLDGNSISIGDSDTGASVSIGDTSAGGTSVGVTGGLGGTTTAATASLDTTNGTNANVNLGIFSSLLNNTTIDGSNANAFLGLPGIGTLGLNQSGTTLGVGLGTQNSTQNNTTQTNNAASGSNLVANLSDQDLARYKVRCRGILANPRAFDRDLLALCRLVASMVR
ncbi:MAG: hypothetical protein KDJ90_17760 [Nitratireductor sp.]|nr:hypothetical protein [Nitratireductor sp.]